MPEMHFQVRWPDNSVSVCYSPSLVVKDFFQEGASYSLEDFLQRSREALTIASNRVKEKYGFHCTSAMQQLHEIEARVSSLKPQDGRVTVEAFLRDAGG